MPVTDIPSLLYKMQHEAKGDTAQNVLGNESGLGIIAAFEELGKLSWESFASSRLPLLKLPPDIIDVLRSGKIEYTKAQMVARVKDQNARESLLEEVIAQDLSLSEIRLQVKALQPKVTQESPKVTIQSITRRLSQSKIWEDPKKWKQVETLLKKLEALIPVEAEAETEAKTAEQVISSEEPTEEKELKIIDSSEE